MSTGSVVVFVFMKKILDILLRILLLSHNCYYSPSFDLLPMVSVTAVTHHCCYYHNVTAVTQYNSSDINCE